MSIRFFCSKQYTDSNLRGNNTEWDKWDNGKYFWLFELKGELNNCRKNRNQDSSGDFSRRES